MGKGNQERLQLIFNISITINLLISLVFVVLVEIVGIWFLNNKINISPDRLFAAKVVFQCSIVTFVLGIMTTPFDAEIIAHERMDFYAYVSIFEGLAKLGIVFLLSVIPIDRLILYGLLLVCIAIIVRIINWVFCYRHFPECRYKRCWDKQLFIQMTTFAGWSFMGNTAYSLSQSGINMVLNVFGGPAVNAARGVAFQLTTALNQFVKNINLVTAPHITKTYARQEGGHFIGLITTTSKILFITQACVVVPFLFFTNEFLTLWLGNVPEYSVVFLKLVLVSSLIRSLHEPIDVLFRSNGDLKAYQIFESCLLIVPLIASYLLLKAGFPFFSVFIALIVTDLINQLIIVYIASRKSSLSFLSYSKDVIIPCCLVSLPIILGYGAQLILDVLWFRLLIVLTVISLSSATMIIMGFSREERLKFKSVALSFIRKKGENKNNTQE